MYDLRSGSTPLKSAAAHKSSVQCVSFQLPKVWGSCLQFSHVLFSTCESYMNVTF